MSEDKILYENGPFYAIKCGREIEIRKNGNTHATLIGHLKDLNCAIRFIDRAVKYPANF